MGNGAQHAIATASAAYLCNKYDTTPREICNKHIQELREIAANVTNDGGKKRQSHL